jgi:hypothetical protein
MSFRVAQDHNKAVGKDMTSLMSASTRREDPVAMTRRRSLVFLSLAVVLCLFLLVVNYIVLSCRTSLVVNYIYCLAVVHDISCIVCLFWRLPIRGGSKNR